MFHQLPPKSVPNWSLVNFGSAFRQGQRLAAKRLTFRDVFTAVTRFLFLVAVVIRFKNRHEGLIPRSVLAC